MRLNDYDMPTDELNVTGDLGINDKSVGGNSSSTESVNSGFDPINLNCSLLVTFEDVKVLQKIMELARSVDEDGKQTVYDIVEPTAQAMGVNKVYFSSKVTVREKANHSEAWIISFTLREKRSVAERKDERLNEQAATSPAPATGTTATTTQSPETEPQLTEIEKVLSKVEEWLKPDEQAS